MTINVPLLEATLQQIKDHPDKWDQGEWVGEGDCGTTACFAGTTALLQGWQPNREACSTLIVNGPFRNWLDKWMCNPDQVGDRSVREIAQTDLGLDDAQARLLFESRNRLEMLELIVKGLANGETVDQISDGLAELFAWDEDDG
jgi:hypothetical protein